MSLVTLLALVVLGAAVEVPPLPSLRIEQLPAGVRDRVAAAVRRADEHPRDAGAAGDLGMLLHAYEQHASAAAAYERARALDPAAFEWAYLAGVVRLRIGRGAEAVPALREAVARRPGSLLARLRLGEALLAAEKPEEARTLYRSLVMERPDIAQAQYGLGRAEAACGDAAGAADRYRAATRLFPRYAAARYALGLLYRDLGRRDEAEEQLRQYQRDWREAPPLDDPVLERVAALKQGAAEALAEGVRLSEAGDVAGAIREHERALELDPSLTRAHANLMGFYAQDRRWEKVDEHYRAAMSLDPGLPEIHYNYALTLDAQGRRVEAQEAFRRVLASSPLHAPAHNGLGILLEADGKLDEAAEHYRQAVAGQASYRVARFNLGRVLVALGRPREAVEQFRQILEPDDEETPRYLYALAAAYVRTGDRDTARQYLEAARRKATARGQAELAVMIERDLGRLHAPPRR